MPFLTSFDDRGTVYGARTSYIPSIHSARDSREIFTEKVAETAVKRAACTDYFSETVEAEAIAA
jgi:hypothetical protein